MRVTFRRRNRYKETMLDASMRSSKDEKDMDKFYVSNMLTMPHGFKITEDRWIWGHESSVKQTQSNLSDIWL